MRIFGSFFCIWMLASCAVGSTINFDRDVRPILSEHCFACHGPDENARQAGLRLDIEIELGEELVSRVRSADADLVMPPPETNKPLSDSQIATLEAWVNAGAPVTSHWSFRPLDRPTLPAGQSSNWPANPIDQFVLAQLETEGLSPSSPADPATLCRRVTLDLIGLPPSPEQVDAFVDEFLESPMRAKRRLIDRLMKSPRYGEHMAVPWLEASRYADTDGYQNDRYRYQHVWRDWVLDALNANLPYDQFVIEQVAGDLLPDATVRQQIATGFGRNHRINSEDGSIPEEWRTEYVADRVDTFGTVFLGLTIGCARCHDHKFDPISQQEYYQLFAYFNNIAESGVGPNNGNSPPFIEVPESWPNVRGEDEAFITPDPVKLQKSRRAEGNGLRRPQAGPPTTVMVMHELSEPRETFVLNRGVYDQPDRERPVQARVPQSVGFSDPDESYAPDRLGLARWLFDDRHPLTARVAVNRIWQQFFGTGLVGSSDNFGVQGSRPSHPELLDWLATEFIRCGWDVQAMQRLILTSATYAQSSTITEEALSRDPGNRLLARGPRTRMTAFMLRDQALAASGLLVHRLGGASVKPYMPPKIWSSMSNNKYEQDDGQSLFRRSVYTYWRRTIPPPMMVNFNAANREVCTVATQSTNTPMQALTLMNNKTFVEAAKWLASRMLSETDSPIEFGFRQVLSRRPTASELSRLQDSHEKFLGQFRSDRRAADELLAIGDAKLNFSGDATEHAAMTMVASMLLNLDEAITKD